MRRNPLFYIGKALALGITKAVDFIDRHFAKGTKGAKVVDRLVYGFIALLILLNLIRAFMAAPIVTGIAVGVIALVAASLFTYFKHKE